MKNPKTDLNFPDTLKVETKDEYIKYILLYIIYYILYIQSLTLYVIQDDKLLDRLSTADLELRAFLIKLAVPGTYNLYLRPKLSKRELLEILCHEMVHLKQYESGKLKTSDNKIFYWEGKQYDNKTAYENRPWEIEAFKEQRKIKKQLWQINKIDSLGLL